MTKWNEALCKLFEQLRATGFVLSNFIVIIISFERYFLMCKPFVFTTFKEVYLKKLLLFITLFSIIIGILSMLQLSVYQKVEHKIIFIGVCLPSEMTSTFDFKLKFVITSMFLVGGCIVGFLYLLIFKSAFVLNKKKRERIRLANKANLNALKNKNVLLSVSLYKSNLDLSVNLENECSSNLNNNAKEKFGNEKRCSSMTNLQVPSSFNERRKSSLVNEEICLSSLSVSAADLKRTVASNSSQKFSFLRTNMRMASMIFLVTLVYYVSIIPWCLTINDIIKFNPFIYYTFVINSAVNPIIYGFFNPNFRNNCIDIMKIAFIKAKKYCCCCCCVGTNVQKFFEKKV